MKITNPMMNAVFSSESTNAGISVAMLTFSRVSGFFARLALMNRSSSPLRVCLSMNVRSGFCAGVERLAVAHVALEQRLQRRGR